MVGDDLLERKDGEPNCPAARAHLSFYAAGSLSEVMSHVSGVARSIAERNDGEKREKETERKREKEEEEGNVCSSDHRQFLDFAPGRFFICFCFLHLSASPLLL